MAWSPHSARTTPLPSNWPTLRKAALARDGGRCVQCGSTDRPEVDHYGQPWEHDKLRTLCHEHHRQRTAGQAATARWRYRERRTPEQHPGMIPRADKP